MIAQWIARLHGGRHPDMTAFFSQHFLVFFLLPCLLVYALTPNKLKKYTLLLCSLGFYWLVGGELICYLICSALSVWLLGLWISAIHRKQAKEVKACPKENRKEVKLHYQRQTRFVVVIGIFIHIGLLLIIKYSGFFLENVNLLFGSAFQLPQFLKPLGLSFFTLETVAYLVDVSRGTQQAERSYLNMLLFLSFFPKVVEGPICRYEELSSQFDSLSGIRWDNLVRGGSRILYGLMKKLVVADRLNIFVESVFSEPESFPGGALLLGAVCYTIQLYMDFSGSMDAVCGMSEIIGVRMPENFRRPFFAKTVSEFWTRWHVTLGSFFRYYVFYPVGISSGVKKLGGMLRKKLGNSTAALFTGAISLFCVWFCNGLWHGAAWNYVFFGMYHFVIIFIGTILAPLNPKIHEKLGISRESVGYRTMQHLRTCILVVIGELFFRASSVTKGFFMLRKIVSDFSFRGGITWLKAGGIDIGDLVITAVTCLIVLAIGLLQERGEGIRERLSKKPAAISWILLMGMILFTIIFGAYGPGYLPIDPMYANF